MPGKVRNIGIWIDHRQAVVVALDGDDVAVETVASQVEGRARVAGGARSGTPYGPQDVRDERALERRYEQQLRSYYANVLDHIGEASSIYAFGPARARYELLEAVETSPHYRDVPTETAPCDKLTDAQVVAHVKEHFAAGSVTAS